MLRLARIVGALTLLISGSVFAETEHKVPITDSMFALTNTEQLRNLCGADVSDPLYERATAFCIGFFTGAMNFYGALTEVPDFKPFVCSGREIARYEMIGVFLDWAEQNPDHMQDAPVQSAARSAAQKWPCKD